MRTVHNHNGFDLPLSGEVDSEGHPRIAANENGEFPVAPSVYRVICSEGVDYELYEEFRDSLFNYEGNRAVIIDGHPLYSFYENWSGIANAFISEPLYRKIFADHPYEDGYPVIVNLPAHIGNVVHDTNNDLYMSITVDGVRKSFTDFIMSVPIRELRDYNPNPDEDPIPRWI